jgi:hypothetical protein
MMLLIRGIGVAESIVSPQLAQRLNIDARAVVEPSKPATVIHYLRISKAIRGFRQLLTSSEK